MLNLSFVLPVREFVFMATHLKIFQFRPKVILRIQHAPIVYIGSNFLHLLLFQLHFRFPFEV